MFLCSCEAGVPSSEFKDAEDRATAFAVGQREPMHLQSFLCRNGILLSRFGFCDCSDALSSTLSHPFTSSKSATMNLSWTYDQTFQHRHTGMYEEKE
eukprot:2684771-Amphidinium_carterae.1